MITTKDSHKIKERKDEKLTIISTDDVKPVEFTPKGKPAEPNEMMVTTSNYEDLKRQEKKLTMKEKMAKVRAAKKKK